jgi:hypothetical protein
LKVDIGSLFVSHGSPEGLLTVKLWMIGWQVMDVESTLFEQKGIDALPFMPSGIIHPEINDLSFEAGQNLLKEFEEPTGIAFNGFHQTMKAVQRINPSKEIQSLSVLTAGLHVGLGAFLDPDSQREPLSSLYFGSPDGVFFNVLRKLCIPSSDA